MAISLYNKRKMPLWLSGIVICISGPIIAMISGSFFVKMDHSAGGTGEGGTIGAAFIGLIIVANGIIYLIAGFVVKIKSLFK